LCVVTTPALFAAYPALAKTVPWLSLGQFPTRVHRVDGLAPAGVELWVKRDDESGAEYGGNKVRKLEFLLADARARGAKRLCTLGGIGSHHVLATALYGKRAGFDVEAVVFPQPMTEHVREQLLVDLAVGAELVPTRGYAGVPLRVWQRRAQPGTQWIAAGGSSPVGTLGYVSGGLELVQQIARGELPRPDVVYVALGSCGTAAGLVIGLSELGGEVELVAVRVTDRLVANARKTRRLMDRTLTLLRADLALAGGPARLGLARDANRWARPRLRVEHGYFGGAYGRETDAAAAAVRDAAAAGLRLETTYTGKTMAALLADARAGRLDGKRVLYWHTYSGADLSPLVRAAPPPEKWPAQLRRYLGA
jgi:1-aminocyclopropane-1-carboxylate deaminase/D-cysteine desulfhydrase-like pyridoxal-dependent ACC family enzyme